LHAPFGSRVNRAWGLALRKRFCRSFNFELQAAATEDAIVLSLGPQHSFPLEDVFQYLKPETAEHLLVQAMLDAPMFGSRWRWNATRALAVLRARGGKKVPTPLQRMDAEDLVAAVFPDQLACPENLVGDREIPDHPLVQQTIADCLLEAMDFPGLKRVLEGMAAGQFTLVARDTTEPSPLAHEVINAKPYAFLDDAPLEERRTQAVITRRGLDVKTAEELGKLDQAAIDRVKEEAWPEVASADELHDALLVMGAIPNAEVGTRNAEQQGYFEELARAGRAGTRTSRSARSSTRASCCAAGSLPASWSSNGASGACSPASTATRSTGCARKSSRSRRRTSCGSCSSGSAPHPMPGPRGRKGLVQCSSCSTDTRRRRRPGRRTCSPRGSATTTLCGSTACACPGRSPGAGCRRRRRRTGGVTKPGRFAPRRLRCFAGSGEWSGSP